jgi:hypothetical protein
MGDDVDQAKQCRDALLWMLKAAFLDIRAADTLNYAAKIADVFHVLPTAMANCASVEELEAQFLAVVQRAKRHGLDSYILALRGVADKEISRVL